MKNQAVHVSEKESENKAIYSILLKILEKWRTDWGQKKEEELEKTVILSSGSPTRPEPPSPLEFPEEKEEGLAETVMIPPKEGRVRLSSPLTMEKPKEPEPLVKTEELPEKDEFLEETIILKPKKVR